MCRALNCGGRRCKDGWTTAGKAKHNQRRRENRAIRRNAAEWARANGRPRLAEQFAEQDPGKLKEFLIANGKNPDDFKDGVPNTEWPFGAAHTDPGDAARVAQAIAAANAAAPPGRAGAAAQPPAPAGGPAAPRVAAPRRVGAGGGGGGQPVGQAPPPTPPRASGSGWEQDSWCTPGLQPRVQAAIDGQGGHRDERSLLSGKPGQTQRAAGGTNETTRVELDNGLVGYHKPFEDLNHGLARGFGQKEAEQSLHEAAAWQLASRMGPPYSEVVPPVVIREVNGKLGSFAVERPGKPMRQDVDSLPEWREAAFFDSLIGQQDRHASNYLVSGDRLALIDHGYTFARPGDIKNQSRLVDKRRRESPALTYQEREVLQRVVSSPDLLGMRNVLSADRADAMQHRAERMLARGKITSTY